MLLPVAVEEAVAEDVVGRQFDGLFGRYEQDIDGGTWTKEKKLYKYTYVHIYIHQNEARENSPIRDAFLFPIGHLGVKVTESLTSVHAPIAAGPVRFLEAVQPE